MDKELLKNINIALKSLVKEQQAEVSDTQNETEVTKLALMLESNQSIVDAINKNQFDIDRFAEVVQNAVKSIKIDAPKVTVPTVQVPEVKVPPIILPEIKIPDIIIPEIHVPEPKVTVHVPPQPAPIVNVSPTAVTFPEKMDVGLGDFNFKNPLPVIQVDPSGNYVTPTVGGGASARRVKIDNTASEPIPISGTISASFSADFGSGEIGSQTLRTVQATNAISSVYVTGANGTIGVVTINPDGLPVYGGSGSSSSVSVTDIFGTVGTNVVNPDGRLKVELPSGASGLTDTELRASHIDVQQVSGAIDSVNVVSTVGLTDTQLRASHIDVQQVSGAIDSVSVIGTVSVSGTFFQSTQPVSVANTLDVQQVSGASWSTNVLSMPAVVVTSITNSVATSILNGDGTTLDPRNRNWTITETVPISSANTLDVKQVSGASDSVNVLSMPSVTVTSITNSTATTILNGEGVARDTWGSSQVGTWNIGTVTSVTNTIAVANVDSTGVQYSGSNPMPTKEQRSATPSQSSVSVTVASTSILASNANRLGATIYNEGSAICYMKLGATASLTSYTLQIASGGYYEVPFGYTGAIDGITSASTAQLRITEIT